MSNGPGRSSSEAIDIGDYCRRVEEHLGRVNEGQIIRIVGASFELVRSWARAGIPLSVACYGIDRKAERHRAGQSRRTLRLEFCEADVRAVYDQWRRAIGVSSALTALDPDADPETGVAEPTGSDSQAGEVSTGLSGSKEERRQPSLSRELERAMDRLSRAAGRLDVPDSLRAAMASSLDALAPLRDLARRARGPARAAITTRLVELDQTLAAAARTACGSGIDAVRAEASAELAAYRGRLSADVWRRSTEASVDRLLRERYGLPTLDPDRV